MLIKNVFSAGGQTLIQTVVLLVLYRYLLDTIGVEKLGIWSVVLATASAARLSELGLAGSVTKFVATYSAQGNYEAAAEVLQTAVISLGAVLGIVLMFAYPGLFWALPHVLPAEGLGEGRAILPYGLVSLWLTAVASIWMSGLDARLRSDLRAGIMIFGSLVYLLMSLVSVVRYGLVGLAVAQVVQGAILVVLGWVFVRRVIPGLPLIPVKWRAVRFREILGYGVNFQINSAVMLLFEPITKILLGRYGGLAAAGYFEMAQRLVMKVRAFIVESNRVIVPVFAGMHADSGDSRKLYISNMRYLFFMVTPVFAVLLAFLPAISEAWIGSFQRQFVLMAACLTSVWYLNSITAAPYFAYLGQGRLRWITVAHIIMGSTNIVAGLVLGHYFGWQGVIAAFSVALVLGSLIPFWAYHYEKRLRLVQILCFHDAVLASVCIGAAAISLVTYWIAFTTGGDMLLPIVLITSGMSIATIAVTWFHPLRRQIFLMIKRHMSRNPGEA